MNQEEPAREPATSTGVAANANERRELDDTAAARLGETDAQREIDQLRARLAASEARERALVHELQHRVQNLLAVIRSIYRRTRESGSDQDDLNDHFQGRLDVVARHHSQAGRSTSGLDLEDMLRDELLEVQCADGPNCTISGPPVWFRGDAAEMMRLAFHELTTNAIKFGALAKDGKLAIEWSVEDRAEGQLLDLRWTETGASFVSSAPRPYGFGRQLIEEAMPYQIGAVTSFSLKPGRLECSIQLPLPASSGPEHDHPPFA